MVHLLESQGYIKNPQIRDAFLQVDRANFVPEKYRSKAYFDTPLPIGHAQTISAPSMVAIMLHLLEIEQNSKVLEIGTGSGYNACLLACLGARVFTIERLYPLYEMAKENMKQCPYRDRITILFGDGSGGFPKEAPYQRIMVTCGAPDIPKPLVEQLENGGIMVIPVGGTFFQELYVVEKDSNGNLRKRIWGDVAFVPMVGKYGHRWA